MRGVRARPARASDHGGVHLETREAMHHLAHVRSLLWDWLLARLSEFLPADSRIPA